MVTQNCGDYCTFDPNGCTDECRRFGHQLLQSGIHTSAEQESAQSDAAVGSIVAGALGVVAVAGVVLAVALRRRELKPAQLSTDDHDLTNDSDYSSL
jgi:hypothetical protein